ncbi:hypothetical protein B0O99DRAFT_638014 [Bisporella sp. PMI_857]|nr:hypothetical protein B0O99DRAFT_638014 [Bisporella sp. PMI_857]
MQGPSMECFDVGRSTLGLPQSPVPNVYGAFFDLQTFETYNASELLATIFIGVICDVEDTRQQQGLATTQCLWIYRIQSSLAPGNDFTKSVMNDLENGDIATFDKQSPTKVELEFARRSFSDSPGNQTRPVLIRLSHRDRTAAAEQDLLNDPQTNHILEIP